MRWLSNWWARLRGADRDVAVPAKPGPAAGSPVAKDASSGELELADDAPKPRRSRVGAAGFDPYSSDAGYAKPHSWERIERD